jgi:hypothetical protein
MELVKLGVLVPAFDGFEEMFVQNASGDALSAVGNLMRTLDSSGSVLIAARKAYFEYQDIKIQAKLFDSIGGCSVVFSRISLQRWAEKEFVDYARQRLLENPENIYSQVAERLGANHPLLTRAVLVKRLLDVADSVSSLSELLQKIGSSPNDYFAVFVRAIIEREAGEKWIDSSGEAAKPLLSSADHFDLLALIAQEMWSLSTDGLKADVLDLLTELFCESRRLPPAIAFQVRERTKQHAMIVSTDGSRNSFAFDHEEFKNFFLGEAIGRACAKSENQKKQDLLSLLRKGALPPQSVEAAVAFVRRSKISKPEKIASFLQEIAQLDGPSSFTHENIGSLVIGIINHQSAASIILKGLTFRPDILRDASLSSVTFQHCSFGPTSLDNATLSDCSFELCHFERLEFHQSTRIKNCKWDDASDIVSIIPVGRDLAVFNPQGFGAILQQAGFTLTAASEQREIKFDVAEDPDVKLLRRLLRHLFLRSTHINENVVLRKLGPGAEMFIKNIVPRLIDVGMLQSDWIPRDHQKRYHLKMSMERINQALSKPNVSIESLIKELAE